MAIQNICKMEVQVKVISEKINMSKPCVKVVNTSNYPLPEYKTPGSAGMDLINVGDQAILEPGKRALFPTGLCIELPQGMEAQVRPRSGLALKQGITVLNTPGTIDSDYRGEIGVILINLGEEPVTINPGDRIAQLVFAWVNQVDWIPSDTLRETDRGAGGYGHTGKQ